MPNKNTSEYQINSIRYGFENRSTFNINQNQNQQNSRNNHMKKLNFF
jgi:hypothetical protein